MAAIAAGVVALVVAAAVSGPGSSGVTIEPEVSFALPATSGGCHGATALPGGAARVPITVSTVAGQVDESLNVCLGGKGPFAFVLDSGAGQSTIDAGFARRLHLAAAGPASQYFGVGCTGTARPVSSGRWSLDGIALAPQKLTAAALPQMGGKGQPVGLLGSDVLSRFGAIRIDFATGSLVLPGPEGPPLAATGTFTGPLGPPPTLLTKGQGTTVPLTVTPVPGDIFLSVVVRFAGGPRRDFVVDTGSSQSVVSSAVAHRQSLATTDLAQRQDTVCSVITVPLVRSGPWSVPGMALRRQLVGSMAFGSAGLGGIEGLLGSDQLKHFGWVVLDYRGGRMVLG